MNAGALLGSVRVHTTVDRTSTPEEIAKRAADRIVCIGEQSHPVIRDQAHAFKEQIHTVVAHYIREAQRAERERISHVLDKQGRHDLSVLVGSL